MTSIDIAVFHATQFLTAPLLDKISILSLSTLRVELREHLVRRYSMFGHWNPKSPSSGSDLRALRFSSRLAAPTGFGRLCKSAGVDWAQWLQILEDNFGMPVDFTVFVNPGRVSVTNAYDSVNCTIYEDLTSETNSLFAEIDLVRESPGWQSQCHNTADYDLPTPTPVRTHQRQPSKLQYEVPVIGAVPTCRRVSHSRNSSYTSVASFVSSGSSFAADSPDSTTSTLPTDDSEAPLSWRTRKAESPSSYAPVPPKPFHSRFARLEDVELPEDFKCSGIHIDFNRAPTKYDGGKTMVLSGGVMLGPRN